MELEYRALVIKNISHFLNIPEGITQEELKGKLFGKNHYKTSYNLEENTLAIDVRSELYYREKPESENLNKIFHIEVRNVFYVKDLSNYIIEEGSNIEPTVMEYFLGISIAQTRGIQSTIISNTPLSSTLIPIHEGLGLKIENKESS